MEENLEKQLSALDENALSPIVRMATEDDSAEIVTWSFRRISGEALNPISAGVYRLWGNAHSQGNAKPWSATLQRWGRAITILFDLGEEARDLASS